MKNKKIHENRNKKDEYEETEEEKDRIDEKGEI